MKIVRFLNDEGKAQFGAQHEGGSVTRIEGCIFSDHHDTGEAASVSKLLAPVKPAAVLCIGLNYRKHAEEGGADIPENPVLFMKMPSTVQNPGDPILLPTKLKSEAVDYECELAVVIGRDCKMSPRPTRSTTCSATPAPTMSVPVTGRRTAAADNGAGARRSTHSARLAQRW